MKKKMPIKANAKINLTLDVLDRRSDGYHDIDSIFEEISLHDNLEVCLNDSKTVNIQCDDPHVPCDERNIVYKAFRAFTEYTECGCSGVNISIQKNIPSQAGMGGGSSDAAAVLRALNELAGTHLDDDTLVSVGSSVGADVGFFIKGGLAHVTGLGEKIKQLDPLPKHYIVCAKGASGISTAHAYKMIDTLSQRKHQQTDIILENIKNKDIAALMDNSVNTFELVTDDSDVSQIMSILKSYNCLGTRMSGSGSSVFGIFTDKNSARSAAEELSGLFPFSYLAENI